MRRCSASSPCCANGSARCRARDLARSRHRRVRAALRAQGLEARFRCGGRRGHRALRRDLGGAVLSGRAGPAPPRLSARQRGQRARRRDVRLRADRVRRAARDLGDPVRDREAAGDRFGQRARRRGDRHPEGHPWGLGRALRRALLPVDQRPAHRLAQLAAGRHRHLRKPLHRRRRQEHDALVRAAARAADLRPPPRVGLSTGAPRGGCGPAKKAALMAIVKPSPSGRGRLYAGLSAPERRAERRGRLLDAGLELFGTIGFAKTTIPMLCSASGVTARHFYEEFASREELLRTLYDGIAETAFERVIDALRRRDNDVRDRIRDSSAAYFRYLTSDPRLARIYSIEAVGMHEELETHRREKREAFVKQLTKAAQRVQSPIDSRLLSAAIAGASHDLLLEWVLAPRRPSVEKLTETITTLWIRTLGLDRDGATR